MYLSVNQNKLVVSWVNQRQISIPYVHYCITTPVANILNMLYLWVWNEIHCNFLTIGNLVLPIFWQNKCIHFEHKTDFDVLCRKYCHYLKILWPSMCLNCKKHVPVLQFALWDIWFTIGQCFFSQLFYFSFSFSHSSITPKWMQSYQIAFTHHTFNNWCQHCY